MFDKIKLFIAVLLVVAGIVGFHQYEKDVAFLYRVLALLGLIGLAFAIAAMTEIGSQTISFGRASVLEARKAVWPSRKETMQTTGIVLVMVIVMGLILWIFDSLLLMAVKWLTGQGG